MKKKALKLLMDIEENFIGILLALMTVLVFVATVARYTGLVNLPWADELSRYCMIWLIFIGICAGANHGSHFEVSVIVNLLPIPVRKVVGCIKTTVVIAFNLLVSWYSFTLIQNAMRTSQTSPALNIPMWIIYLAIPVGCVLMSVSYGIHEYTRFIRMSAENENPVEDEDTGL